jgi:hypothetical protein
MRSHLPVPRLSPLLALLVLSGCNTAYREAMALARDAAIRGDFLTAARAYRDACTAKPEDELACTRVPLFAEKATAQALESARPACEAGDLDRCLPPLLDAWDLSPHHAELSAMFEKAGQLHTERCAQWSLDGPLNGAVTGLACLQSRGRQLPISSYQTRLAGSASRVASRFVELALTAQGQNHAGAATVLWSAAQCLAPGENLAPRVERARQNFLSQSALPVSIRLDGSMPPPVATALSGVCAYMAAELPPWARCASPQPLPGDPEPLQLQVNAVIQMPEKTRTEDVRSVRYVSGTERVRNPDYDTAEENLALAESDLRSARDKRKQKDAECEKAQEKHEATCVTCPTPKSPCDEAREAASEEKDAESARDQASRTLSNTPNTVLVDTYDDFTYSVWTHRWKSGFRFTLQASTPSSTPFEQVGEMRFEDREHVGFGPAGLVADPLVVPPPQAYADLFLQQLAPPVLAAVKRDAQARGAVRGAQCGALPADGSVSWVQCWAEAALWKNGQAPQPTELLQLLATSVDSSAQPLCR